VGTDEGVGLEERENEKRENEKREIKKEGLCDLCVEK